MAEPTRDQMHALARCESSSPCGYHFLDHADWQEAEVIALPTNDFESALIHTLPVDGASYTAIVRGVNNTTGIAVVEVYALQ